MQRSVCQIIAHIGDQKGEFCCSMPLKLQSYRPVCARAPFMLGYAVPLPAFCCHGWDCLRLLALAPPKPAVGSRRLPASPA